MTNILDEVDAFLKKTPAEPEPEPEPEEPETQTEEPTESSAHMFVSKGGTVEPYTPAEPETQESEEVLTPLKTYRAKLPSAQHLVTYLRLLKAGGIEEATFNWNRDEIRTRHLDPAHITLSDLTIRSEAFEEFDGPEDKEGMTVSVVDLLRLFGKKKHKGWLELVWTPATHKLLIREGGEEWNSDVLSETTVGCLEITAETPPSLKTLTFDTEGRVEPKMMSEALDDLQSVSDYVVVSFEDEHQGQKLVLTGKGDIADKKYRIPMFGLAGPTETKATYSINYLTRFLKAVKKEKIPEVYIALSTKKPLKIWMIFPAAEFTYLIAPRIDTEES